MIYEVTIAEKTYRVELTRTSVRRPLTIGDGVAGWMAVNGPWTSFLFRMTCFHSCWMANPMR